MKLLEKIDSQLKEAIKKNDTIRAETLKMLKTDITYEKAKKGEELSDDKILEVISRAAKKRKEAIDEYTKAGRKDRADEEAAELKIIQEYLPEQLSREEIVAIIDKKISSLGEITKKDFGKIMGSLMQELKGKADGALVKEILNQKIGD